MNFLSKFVGRLKSDSPISSGAQTPSEGSGGHMAMLAGLRGELRAAVHELFDDDGNRRDAPKAEMEDIDSDELAPSQTVIRKVFRMVDADGSGSIDVDELPTLFRALGVNLTKAQCEDVMLEADTNGDGELDLEEFQAFFYATWKGGSERKTIEDALAVLDTDGSYTVDLRLLRHVVRNAGQDPLSEADCDLLIGDIKTKWNGILAADKPVVSMKASKAFEVCRGKPHRVPLHIIAAYFMTDHGLTQVDA